MEVLGKEMSREEAFSLISQRKQELLERIKKGQTEEKVSIGGAAFTDSEWKKLIKNMDNNIDEIKKEQKEQKEKVKKEEIQKEKKDKAQEECAHKEKAIAILYEKEISLPYKIGTKLEGSSSMR